MMFSLRASLIWDLQDEVTYYAVLNGLLPGRFKFYLSKSKTTKLVEATRRAQDFTHIAEKLAKMTSSNKTLGREEEKRSTPPSQTSIRGKRRKSPWNILLDIKGNPKLRRPKLIETSAKVKNKNKYFEYYEDFRHITSKYCEIKKALHELANQGGIDEKEWIARYRKSQIRKLSQIIAARELRPLIGPTMTFDLEDIRL
ncbi:hypothetical protein Cgig2_029583 [Carnegiea gigantea]|uniref:Uncharacterized protein n=1 Tax=Carnegiea gigantea TaxID=171969 RepID=A0A9Q1JV03_9CARY|nr:hypothetical protein Cgig2_029583 [Carnegiea gigantea]